MDHVPFHLNACGDLTALRRALEDKGFTQQGLGGLLHPGNPGPPVEVGLDRAASLRRAVGPSPLCVLTRLFVLAQTVSGRRRPPGLGADRPGATGGHRPGPIGGGDAGDAAGVRAEVSLLPMDDLLLARDFRAAVTGVASPADYVPRRARPRSSWPT